MKTNLTRKKTFRFIADGCGGQNNNSTGIGMCYLWLMSAPKHTEVIELVFPIAGHSFIPPDRVFGNIEKEVTRMEVIIDPKEYTNIIGNHVIVAMLRSDCQVFDWKQTTKSNIKPPELWHSQFSLCKRFYLKR
jgi:hypothetical protein